MENLNNKENNHKIAKFMGYIYHHKGIDIDFSDCGGIYDRKEIFSKIPIISEDYPDSDQHYFADIPNPDYNKPETEESVWNPDLKTISWASLNNEQYIYDLKYDSSWNELMPVLEKIENMGHKTIIGGGDFWDNYCNIMYGVSTKYHGEIKNRGTGSTKLIAVYNAIIQFIDWYDLNKK